MHSEYQINVLLDNMLHTHDLKKVVRFDGEERAFFEISRSFGPNIGLRVCGEMDGHGFHRQYYFPYLHGTSVTTDQEILIEPKADGNGFFGEAEDGRVDFALIFSLQNPSQYLNVLKKNRSLKHDVVTTLTGLASSGTILLPAKNNGQKLAREKQREFYLRHEQMVSAAKSGSQEAIENLTMEDMDTYAMISRRIQKEDILSIIDTYFMPYGMESDRYQVLGSILFYTKVRNLYTDETLYQMTVDCNGMQIDICINSQDLYGEPEAGRRFKGNIWLQGELRTRSISRETKTASQTAGQEL